MINSIINLSREDRCQTIGFQAIGRLSFVMCVVAMILLFSSCENPDLGNTADDDAVNILGEGGKIVEFHFSGLSIDDFEGESVALGVQSCARLNFAIFDGDKRLKVINQTGDQPSFGRVVFDMEPGRYRVVALGHNGLGNASISSPVQIKFKDNKVTDTFYYYGTIEVKGSSSFEIPLKRAVAKCQIVIRDRFPATVSQMQFKYTGGSSTFNAVTGYGNSRQTENRSIIAPDEKGATSFDLYTFPHNDNDLLSITVMALSESGDIVASQVIDDVQVNVNKLTRCDGELFGETTESSEGGDFIVTTHDEWMGN